MEDVDLIKKGFKGFSLYSAILLKMCLHNTHLEHAGLLFLSKKCVFWCGIEHFLKVSPILVGMQKGGSRGQLWHVIMACHFSSTFLTMHDPDWSQNTQLGSWHSAQKYITCVRGSTSIAITATRRASICVCSGRYSPQHHGWVWDQGFLWGLQRMNSVLFCCRFNLKWLKLTFCPSIYIQ